MFSFKKLAKHHTTGVLKDHIEAKQYIEKFFYPLSNGEHALLQNGKITIVQKDTMKDVYLERFPDDIKKWYKTQTIPRELVCDVSKPQIGNTFINTAPNMFKERKKYSTFTQKSKDGVEKMLGFLREVWCSDNDEQLTYLLSWYSEVLKGKKNQSILYVKSIEGVGKSTFSDFFIEYVLGNELYAKGDKDCLCTSNNMDLLGKPYVIFEELPVLNKNEWAVCDGKLKDMATGTEMNYCDKYCKKFRAKNINNYEAHTNHKAIKRPDGRRYYVVDINTKYCNDYEFFADLRNTCFNDKVGYAFYNYLMELDTENFNSLEMPETQSKLNMIADLLTPIEKFLKKEFLLQNAPIKLKIKDLYAKYVTFCEDNGLRTETKIEFTANLKQYGFEFKCIGGYNCYRISVEQLKTIADKRKWLHELDKDDEECVPFTENKGIDFTDKSVDISAEYTMLLTKYNILLKQVNALKKKGFGVLFKDDDEQDEDDDDDDDEEDVKIVAKAPRKKVLIKKVSVEDDDSDEDSDDDEEEVKIVAKVARKKEPIKKAPKKVPTKELTKKDISDCLDTLNFL
jgi:hypothetical protein